MAVVKNGEVGDSAHIETGGQLRITLGVHLEHDCPSCHVRRCSGNLGCSHTARAAPGCPEIDENRNASLGNNLVEQLSIYFQRFGGGRQGCLTRSAASCIRKMLGGDAVLPAALLAGSNDRHQHLHRRRDSSHIQIGLKRYWSRPKYAVEFLQVKSALYLDASGRLFASGSRRVGRSRLPEHDTTREPLTDSRIQEQIESSRPCSIRDLKKQERTAIEAVARRFSATWEVGSNPPDAYIMVAGKRGGTGQGNGAKPRLRFDKVATRLIERVQATLGEAVPDGMTVLLTITAPIRLPSKTAASLEDKIQTLLGRGSPGRDEKDTIHGNRVQIRLLRDGSERAPKMLGFVHNSDSDPLLLLNMTRELLELISAEAGRRAPRLAGDRWLVVISAEGISCLEAYRYIYSQLRMATDFKKILMVFGDGRVGMLTG